MPEQPTPVIAARNLGKTFDGKTVLRDVDLTIARGEIHGLMGQNGSGKSTLIKILSGFHAPDPGAELEVRGAPVHLPLHPDEPIRLGMSFVHQDLGLFEPGSVLENLRIGRYETSLGWRISWRRERARAREALRRFSLDIDPERPVSALADVERAMVAIVRALERLRLGGEEAGLLVLDEPTAYLPYDSIEALFETIRQVAALGHGVLFVSHKLGEVRSLTDRVTILRDGRVVESRETGSLTEGQLVSSVLGFSLEELYPAEHVVEGEVALAAEGVSGELVQDFALEIRRGEIVGVTGLLGMGQEEVPYLLFGAQPGRGSLALGGRTVSLESLSPRRAIELGMALLPGNRVRDGGLPVATAAENVSLPTLGRFVSAGFLNHRRERRVVRGLLEGFDVRPPVPEAAFATFSGGNQQKALIAKWFSAEPEVLLAHEPAQGVDVGAKRQIFRHIRDAAARGMAIVIASVEYEDLAHLCDRVLVFRDGRVVSELHRGALTAERILERCFVVPAGEEGRAAG